MSEMNHQNQRQYLQFDRMSTEELEEILRSDVVSSNDDKYNEDMIWHIMEILAGRRKENPEKEFTGLEKAWESFRENYYPYKKNAPFLHRHIHCDTNIPLGLKTDTKSTAKCRKHRLKYIVGVAAVIVIICSTSLSMSASGYHLWKEIARWTKNTFQFVNSYTLDQSGTLPDSDTQKCLINEYSSLQDALDDYAIEESIVPDWIPERFSLALIEVDENGKDIHFETQYINGEEMLSITVTHIVTGSGGYMMKDDTPVSVYRLNGINHYIMSYNYHNTAAWLNGSNECVIAGDVSQDELRKMIQSIYS